jgi:hypothetical protein
MKGWEMHVGGVSGLSRRIKDIMVSGNAFAEVMVLVLQRLADAGCVSQSFLDMPVGCCALHGMSYV